MKPKVPGSCPALYPSFFYLLSFFFSVFGLFCLLNCFVVFSINIYLNNCYLVKCNEQKEKYCVSRATIEY